jgi:Fe-S cluster assembly ATP-binding protein
VQAADAIPGVSVANFLREAARQVHGDEFVTKHFRKTVKELLAKLGIMETFMTRYINEGFSGGEKKRLEVLQLLLLKPKLAILDETDSGLDVDALKLVAHAVNDFRAEDRALLIITHYQRMLEYIKPDRVHILVDGCVVREGDASLAQELDRVGYDAVTAG